MYLEEKWSYDTDNDTGDTYFIAIRTKSRINYLRGDVGDSRVKIRPRDVYIYVYVFFDNTLVNHLNSISASLISLDLNVFMCLAYLYYSNFTGVRFFHPTGRCIMSHLT